MVDWRPSSGSCARCQDALGSASIKANGVWYCSTACSQGRPSGRPRSAAVPEPWLYPVPKRFYRKRVPRELNAARAEPYPD